MTWQSKIMPDSALTDSLVGEMLRPPAEVVVTPEQAKAEPAQHSADRWIVRSVDFLVTGFCTASLINQQIRSVEAQADLVPAAVMHRIRQRMPEPLPAPAPVPAMG